MKHLQLPLTIEERTSLRAGEMILLSGVIYTARDAAHKRLNELLDQGKELPLPLQDQIIYYVGPTPTPPGHIYGSAGPTTSMRMDAYAPRLYDLGLAATIGKGYRTPAVLDACVRNQALYLVAIGGAGALLGKCVTNAEMLASIDEIDGGLIALTRFSGEIGFYPEEYLRIVELYMDRKRGTGHEA